MNQPEQIPHTSPPPSQGIPAPPPAQASPNDPRVKSPVVAGLLSVMPGLGQVYVGYYQRGFMHIATVAVIITLLASGALGPLIPLAGLFLAFFWLYNMIDAARRAMFYNRALAGGDQDIELPTDFGTPGLRGSIAGGITMIAIGAILLANTRFEISLDWIEEWWPAALIIFGAYLVWKAAQEKASQSVGGDED